MKSIIKLAFLSLLLVNYSIIIGSELATSSTSSILSTTTSSAAARPDISMSPRQFEVTPANSTLEVNCLRDDGKTLLIQANERQKNIMLDIY